VFALTTSAETHAAASTPAPALRPAAGPAAVAGVEVTPRIDQLPA
jgi:hypothetical protein